MNDPCFKVASIDELITAAGIVDDNQKITITGAQLKEWGPIIVELEKDIFNCHKLCTDMGVPDMGEGTAGLVKRLTYLCQNRP
jgi:hypothetical protein